MQTLQCYLLFLYYLYFMCSGKKTFKITDVKALQHKSSIFVLHFYWQSVSSNEIFFNSFYRRTNRLEESRNIFDTIINNLVFRGVSIILFLNKTDLLTQKVYSGESDVRTYFPQFAGDPHNLADVQAFILAMFTSVKRDPRKPLFHHFTTAVDTENIKVVFNAVKDTILHRNLESLMLA